MYAPLAEVVELVGVVTFDVSDVVVVFCATGVEAYDVFVVLFATVVVLSGLCILIFLPFLKLKPKPVLYYFIIHFHPPINIIIRRF
jgi:hypothetical protein